MAERNCGNCNYQNIITPQNMVDCLLDGELHEVNYVCDYFKEFVDSNIDARRDAALKKWREIEGQKNREYEGERHKEERWFRIFSKIGDWLVDIIKSMIFWKKPY